VAVARLAIYALAMKAWLSPARYHALVLFVMMGLFAAILAWNTFDLAHVAIANARLIGNFGLMALMDGGLLQLFEIAVRGAVSLAAYLGFKACEVELVHRWRTTRE
jgi:hypothetical protein